MLNPYEVLGVDRSATTAEIKKAYFTLIREHTPERDPEQFKRIREAYEQLKDASARAQTDLFTLTDPFGEFDLEALEKRAEFDLEAALDEHLFALDGGLSDLNRIDFREDFREIEV